MTRSQLFAAFFFSVFLFLLYQLYRMFAGFLAPLAWAALLALIFHPVQRRLVRWLRGRDGLAAFTLTTLVIGGVIVPGLVLLALVANESVLLYQRIAALVAEGKLSEWLGSLENSRLGHVWLHVQPLLARWNVDLGSIGVKVTNAISGFLVTQATAIAKNVVGFLVDFFLCTVALFFLLRDGERMIQAVRDLLPMEPHHRDLVLARFADALTAVVQGSLLTALAQGTLAGIGYLVLGVPFAVFLGCATALIALVPMGTPLAWGGVAVYLVATGHPIKAVIQVLWGILVVSTIDNVIRPWVIGGRTRIPTILLFFGILGGLQAYGFLGVFLAPAVIALLVAFVRIYREEYNIARQVAAVD
ncbi:MAG: AI-2E family transporter [Candidatus Binatia bacterium]|nr:MAG: AI-2E family transporter [Candidatus Binatia bacterium]